MFEAGRADRQGYFVTIRTLFWGMHKWRLGGPAFCAEEPTFGSKEGLCGPH